ncbi:conserved hypothetical protein [Aeropyrum pernix K1]|uniref:GTP cyclohydrolase MptA n=1 Tax=Aeropyrum pernix (strain ATCC 700893 / DSM 11879 / JCM 9820 / NBRC 100138 / K1) TaxID=272557 RepID=MPTA_AERPE|nr:GTP cyclohydrolase MptA [Aeropyrum pernix]Q9Y9I0.1 RecName: Full=GTP cyclohydrolase MptA; AltName: Full=GTP cyclohydrolase IV [Aeropyrum pernix K1]BAA81320.1 conserved hypothetical protein [Aeropyrum pernix K1]
MDVQDLKPPKPLYLERVGFRGVRRRALLETPEGPVTLDLELDVFVDLDRSKRGVHLSRNIEAVEAVVSERRARSIEGLLRSIAKELLSRHGYAEKATVRARTRYYIDLEAAGVKGREPVDVAVTVSLTRSGGERWRVAVSVKGMTVCPSAQSTIAEAEGISDPSRAPSHSQKVLLKGTVDTGKVMVRIEDLARALLQSFSAPTFTLLKKPQEARLILEAFTRPMFVEDVVREAAWRIAAIPYIPGEALLQVEAVSLESIHPHDLVAMLRSRVSEVRSLASRSV